MNKTFFTDPSHAIGHTLAEDIYQGNKLPLLRCGVVINDQLAHSLTDKGIHRILVSRASNCSAAPMSPDAIKGQRVASLFTDALNQVRYNKITPQTVEGLAKASRQMSQWIVNTPTANEVMRSLRFTDEYTYRHSISVAIYGMTLGKAYWEQTLGFVPEDQLLLLGEGLLLHDVGKMFIPLQILRKSSALTDEEYEIIRQHPQNGYDVVKQAGSIDAEVLNIILQHHERIDGSGYPNQINGSDISAFCRIAAIADTYDAMTSDRPYRKSLGKYAATNVLVSEKGKTYDPVMVDIFCKLFPPFAVGSVVQGIAGKSYVISALTDHPLLPMAKRKKLLGFATAAPVSIADLTFVKH